MVMNFLLPWFLLSGTSVPLIIKEEIPQCLILGFFSLSVHVQFPGDFFHSHGIIYHVYANNSPIFISTLGQANFQNYTRTYLTICFTFFIWVNRHLRLTLTKPFTWYSLTPKTCPSCSLLISVDSNFILLITKVRIPAAILDVTFLSHPKSKSSESPVGPSFRIFLEFSPLLSTSQWPTLPQPSSS